MKELKVKGKRVIAMLMVALLVLGLVPVNPIEVSAEDEAAPSLIINIDETETKGSVVVNDVTDSENPQEVPESNPDSADNKMVYELEEGNLYTVEITAVDPESEKIYNVYDAEGDVVLIDSVIEISSVEADSAFEYTVYFESDATRYVTVEYAVVDFSDDAAVVFGTGVEDSSLDDGNGIKTLVYRVLPKEVVDIIVTPKNSTATVTANGANSCEKDDENSTWTVTIEDSDEDATVELAVEKTDVTVDIVDDVCDVTVLEGNETVNNGDLDGVYSITKGSNVSLTISNLTVAKVEVYIDSVLIDSNDFVDNGDDTFTANIGEVTAAKSIVIKEKQLPKVVVNCDEDKVESIILMDGDTPIEVTPSNNTWEFANLEEGKDYVVVIDPVDDDAEITELTYSVSTDGEIGSKVGKIAIDDISASVTLDITVTDVYTLNFADGYGTIHRLDDSGEVIETVTNGVLYVKEDEKDITLQVVPEEGKYISGLQHESSGVTEDIEFDVDALGTDTDVYTYTFDVTVAEGDTITVSYESIIPEEVSMETIINKVFSNTLNGTGLELDNKEVYYINSNVTLTSLTNGEKLLFDENEGFISSKEVNASMDFSAVTLLADTTEFEEDMFKFYTFDKTVSFVMDTTEPVVNEAGITKYYGPQLRDTKLEVTVEDVNGISKVVYFTTEQDVVNNRADILNSTNVLILTDGVYSADITVNESADTTYYVYAIDSASNISQVEEIVVYYDDKEPDEGFIQIQNITSFLDSTYAKDAIIVVEATSITDPILDNGMAGSGIKSIILNLRNSNGILIDSAELNKTTFSVNLLLDTTYYIEVVATDNVGNTRIIDRVEIKDGFKQIIYDKAAPIISVTPQLSTHTAGVYKDATKVNTYYINKNVFDKGFLFDVLVKDYPQAAKPDNYHVSGLKSVTVKINGQQITQDKDGNDLINYATVGEHVYDEDFVINLAQVPSNNGKYEIEVSAVDQTDRVSDTVKYTVYVDNTKPTIGTIKVNGKDAQQGQFQKYGFFDNDELDIEISSIDGTDSEFDSHIDYYVVEYIQGDNVVRKDTVSGGKNVINTKITDDFKGTIRLTAYDKVGNSTTTSLVNGLILENKSSHNKNAGVTLEIPETSMKDTDGNSLYSDDITVEVVITDTYAGIEEIEWSVEAPYDTDNNDSGSMKMNAVDSDWKIETTDNGVVTKVSGEIPVETNSNNIVVQVTVTDNTGNTSTEDITLSIDKTDPTIEVSMSGVDADTDYANTYNGDRVATITVQERNFDKDDVKVEITNTDGTIPSISDWEENEDESDPDSSTYTATVTFSEDGDYTLDVEYTDLADRKADSPDQQAFTIDKTLPVASVTMDGNAVNGFYFAAGRTATIVIEEHNFDANRIQLTGTATNNGAAVTLPSISSWSTTGDTNTATITFSTDADYTLGLSGLDQAGNAFEYTFDNFVIDQEVPEISISGVEDQSANAGDVMPVITLGDVNYDTNGVNITLVGANNGNMELDGSFSNSENGQVFTFNNFPNEQSYDDIYTLTATKTDMAGNETTETISFSVNRFGSVYTFSDELKSVVGKYVKEPFTIVLTETNIDRLDPETIKVVLTINGTPKTLVRNEDYTIEESGTSGTWKQYVYTIDSSVFEGDGSYSLAIYSVDAAGNVNENINEVKEAEIIFGIDSTAPIIEAINFESGFTNETAYLATVSAIDNIILESLEVLINGEAVEVTEDNGMYSFTIPESSSRQTVVIVATDAAGNVATVEYTDILITSNPFISFINNTPLLIGSVAGVAAVGGGAGGFVFFRKRNVIKVKK